MSLHLRNDQPLFPRLWLLRLALGLALHRHQPGEHPGHLYHHSSGAPSQAHPGRSAKANSQDLGSPHDTAPVSLLAPTVSPIVAGMTGHALRLVGERAAGHPRDSDDPLHPGLRHLSLRHVQQPLLRHCGRRHRFRLSDLRYLTRLLSDLRTSRTSV